MKYALIFPGQGVQRPGMGRDIYEKYQSAKDVFEEADNALGYKISNVIFNGSEEELMLTEVAQPAILTVSIAAMRALEEEMGAELAPFCMAGHSLGEYTSLVAAGAMSVSDGVRLVAKRGELMQKAVPVGMGSMAAIVGLELPDVSAVCAEASQGEVCQAANINAPKQIVISGNADAVSRAVRIIDEKYAARVVPMRVSAPFHCILMSGVGEIMKGELAKVAWKKPKCPIITNVDAKPVTDIPDICDSLYRQTFSPVMWCQSVLEMQKNGVEEYIELGQGNVLTGLVRKICKGVRPHLTGKLDELLATADFISGRADTDARG
ncbi:MAG: ACP S-malonyltransferase [Synergistes sp.]|nr:ACP S-malonyltransferase [Synergistes sp.]